MVAFSDFHHGQQEIHDDNYKNDHLGKAAKTINVKIYCF